MDSIVMSTKKLGGVYGRETRLRIFSALKSANLKSLVYTISYRMLRNERTFSIVSVSINDFRFDPFIRHEPHQRS